MDHFLCSQNLMIFIGGHGSDEESSKLTSDQIYAWMGKNTGQIPLRSVKYIVNNADRQNNPPAVIIPPELIQCVQEAAKSVHPCKMKGGISLIFFVHSLGSNVIFEALRPGRINLGDRSHIAIFSFGGTQEIPTRYGEIVKNFVIKGDELAYYGKLWHGGKLASASIIEIDATKEQKKKVEPLKQESRAGFSASIAGVASMVVNPVMGAAMATVGTTRGLISASKAAIASPHYIHDYFQSQPIYDHIWNYLGMNDPESETCSCRKRNVMKEEWVNRNGKTISGGMSRSDCCGGSRAIALGSLATAKNLYHS